MSDVTKDAQQQGDVTQFTAEQFSAIIKQIVSGQARLTRNVGSALLMVLYFANHDGNVAPANELIGALRKSMKKQGIIDLLQEHGNLAWTAIGKKKPEFVEYDAGKEWTAETVKELREVCASWEDYIPTAEEDPIFDLVKAVEGAAKRGDQAKKNHRTVKGEALLAKIKALVAEYHAAEADAELAGA